MTTTTPGTGTGALSLDDLCALDAEHGLQTYGRLPVAFVRGEGTLLYDSEGRRYLDFLGGLAVTSLGHAHPTVADAIADQARTLLHVSNLYFNELQPQLAARLDGLLGGGGRVFFANSGAEANECAIKLARRHGQINGGPARHEILGAYASFHGRTLTTLAATGQPQKHEPFQPLPPGFRHVPFADVDALAGALDERVCAVLLEPLQGEGGVNVAPPGYLEAVRALCDEREALLIMDEVQTGLGRTGRWFGFQHSDVTPDIVTMAKALGNGVPIGACWARDEVATAFRLGDHASTFGGQPLAARAALAVLDVMETEDVPARASTAGATLQRALEGLPEVVSVRGEGLLLAAELAPGIESGPVATACLTAGLVLNAVTPTALRFAPSLLVSEAEIAEAVEILRGVLDAHGSSGGGDA
jgi:acetylornithine/N-succinyldiaminopimelate aminotransferase